MKNLFRISFLLTALCFAIPVYADGDMSTGNKNCTQNCGLVGGINQPTTTLDGKKQDEFTIGNVYIWFYKQISEILN